MLCHFTPASLLIKTLCAARPLGSTGITPLPRYYGPLRLPDCQGAAYVFASPLVAFYPEPTAGSPSLPNRTFPAHCPLSPRRIPVSLVNVASLQMAGFRFSGTLATLSWCNQADSGSLALRLTRSLRGAPTRRSLPALSASLHVGRSVRMMNTFLISSFGGAGAPEGTDSRRESNQTRSTNRLEFFHQPSTLIH